jgi:hypothetical protein
LRFSIDNADFATLLDAGIFFADLFSHYSDIDVLMPLSLFSLRRYAARFGYRLNADGFLRYYFRRCPITDYDIHSLFFAIFSRFSQSFRRDAFFAAAAAMFQLRFDASADAFHFEAASRRQLSRFQRQPPIRHFAAIFAAATDTRPHFFAFQDTLRDDADAFLFSAAASKDASSIFRMLFSGCR